MECSKGHAKAENCFNFDKFGEEESAAVTLALSSGMYDTIFIVNDASANPRAAVC